MPRSFFRSPFVFHILLLFFLALVSGYQVPDLTDANWDTVLFLTPLGILENHADTDSVLKTFYSDISAGQLEASLLQALAMLTLYLGLIWNFFRINSGSRRTL